MIRPYCTATHPPQRTLQIKTADWEENGQRLLPNSFSAFKRPQGRRAARLQTVIARRMFGLQPFAWQSNWHEDQILVGRGNPRLRRVGCLLRRPPGSRVSLQSGSANGEIDRQGKAAVRAELRRMSRH